MLCCAGLAPLAPDGEMGVLPPGVVPVGLSEPELPPLPEPELPPELELDWPGVKFSGAWAARAVKACMVLLPDAGLL